jgi:hypothetical protein
MRKYLIVALMGLLVAFASGCSSGDSTSTEPAEVKTRCLDGVTYYMFREFGFGYYGYGYMAPKYNRDGTLDLCN